MTQKAGGTEYIRADHALAPVAAAYEDAAKFALDTADQEQGDDGVTWGDMAQIADAIHSRTPADAQAALERVKREARNEALREAARVADHYAQMDYGLMHYPECDALVAGNTAYQITSDILALTTENQSDE